MTGFSPGILKHFNLKITRLTVSEAYRECPNSASASLQPISPSPPAFRITQTPKMYSLCESQLWWNHDFPDLSDTHAPHRPIHSRYHLIPSKRESVWLLAKVASNLLSSLVGQPVVLINDISAGGFYLAVFYRFRNSYLQAVFILNTKRSLTKGLDVYLPRELFISVC